MSPPAQRKNTVKQGLRHPSQVVRILLSRPLLTMVAALIFVATNGCVLPVGPDFQDPQGKLPPQPFKPTFTSVDPPFWTVVGLDTAAKRYFTVGIEDINPTDKISVRWVFNYPPYVQGSTKIYLDTTTSNQPPPLVVGLTCNDVEPYKLADRNMVIIVSENGFIDESAAGDRMNPLSYDASGALVPLVGGWRLMGCP